MINIIASNRHGQLPRTHRRFSQLSRVLSIKRKGIFDQLAHGQEPKSLVIACCDSRVDPAILLGGKPGDLFVVRSIAALIPPVGLSSPRDAVMSALEYGVKHLDVDHLIVMGHSACGGIHAALFPEK